MAHTLIIGELVIRKQRLVHGIAVDIRSGEQAQKRRVLLLGGDGFIGPIGQAAQVVNRAVAQIAQRLRRLRAFLRAAAIDVQFLRRVRQRLGGGLRQLLQRQVHRRGNVPGVIIGLSAHVHKRAVCAAIEAFHGFRRRDGGCLRALRQGQSIQRERQRQRKREPCVFFHRHILHRVKLKGSIRTVIILYTVASVNPFYRI